MCIRDREQGFPDSITGGLGLESRTPELLRELCGVDGLEWVRLLYVHPRHLSDEIIEVLATEPKMCRYLDLPVQHSVGRTDLPGGDWETLKESITKQVFNLPGAVVIFPGHGPRTSVADEQHGNPYVGGL